MSYRIAGIDVHKRMLAVVVADVHVEGEYQLNDAILAATPSNSDYWRDGCWSRWWKKR